MIHKTTLSKYIDLIEKKFQFLNKGNLWKNTDSTAHKTVFFRDSLAIEFSIEWRDQELWVCLISEEDFNHQAIGYYSNPDGKKLRIPLVDSDKYVFELEIKKQVESIRDLYRKNQGLSEEIFDLYKNLINQLIVLDKLDKNIFFKK